MARGHRPQAALLALRGPALRRLDGRPEAALHAPARPREQRLDRPAAGVQVRSAHPGQVRRGVVLPGPALRHLPALEPRGAPGHQGREPRAVSRRAAAEGLRLRQRGAPLRGQRGRGGRQDVRPGRRHDAEDNGAGGLQGQDALLLLRLLVRRRDGLRDAHDVSSLPGQRAAAEGRGARSGDEHGQPVGPRLQQGGGGLGPRHEPEDRGGGLGPPPEGSPASAHGRGAAGQGPQHRDLAPGLRHHEVGDEAEGYALREPRAGP
mmetsp:Transcript_100541/g.216962  ORF Transcript_100541/g.216962 Transcript_100541/m.216962 type:complete len:263 (-) Transcript_100541:95-883(-)